MDGALFPLFKLQILPCLDSMAALLRRYTMEITSMKNAQQNEAAAGCKAWIRLLKKLWPWLACLTPMYTPENKSMAFKRFDIRHLELSRSGLRYWVEAIKESIKNICSKLNWNILYQILYIFCCKKIYEILQFFAEFCRISQNFATARKFLRVLRIFSICEMQNQKWSLQLFRVFPDRSEISRI